MTEPVVINFVVPHEGNACAIVRSEPGLVGITLSIQSNSDTAVFMRLTDAETLSKALLDAIDLARKSSGSK